MSCLLGVVLSELKISAGDDRVSAISTHIDKILSIAHASTDDHSEIAQELSRDYGIDGKIKVIFVQNGNMPDGDSCEYCYNNCHEFGQEWLHGDESVDTTLEIFVDDEFISSINTGCTVEYEHTSEKVMFDIVDQYEHLCISDESEIPREQIVDFTKQVFAAIT